MARVFITGSAGGLGQATARALLDDGHDVVIHARNDDRVAAVRDLLDRGAAAVTGDLADLDQACDVADQVNRLGRMDAVIHNAGVIDGPRLLPVNVVAPYVLTATIRQPGRSLYLSSSLHRGGRPDLVGVNWSGTRQTRSYSDSKLFVTTLMSAIARLWPDTLSHAVDPGWVPTKMGGPSASDDLTLGHVTQAWLATTDAAEALTSGRYWHHQHTETPHRAVNDERFQDELLTALAAHTGIELPTQPTVSP